MFAALAALQPAAAHAGVGKASGATLLQPMGVRPAALGEAYSAEAGTVDVLGYNPAGLRELARRELALLYHAGFAGDRFISAIFGGPVGGGGAALGLALADAGSVERLVAPGQLITVSAQRDVLAHAGAGFGLPGLPADAGGAVKLLVSELVEERTGSELAFDAGLRTGTPVAGLTAGVAVQHAGDRQLGLGKLDVPLPDPLDRSGRRGLPFQVRAAAAYTAAFDAPSAPIGALRSLGRPAAARRVKRLDLVVMIEATSRIQESLTGFAAGTELLYARCAAVRAGFRTASGGLAAAHRVYTLGGGFRTASVRVDYALELLEFAAVHRFGLTFAAAPRDGRPARPRGSAAVR